MSAETAKQYPDSIDISHLVFRDPDNFRAGGLHACIPEWDKILAGSPMRDTLLDWLCNGVNVFDFITHFEGSFSSTEFDHDLPPPREFKNSNSCLLCGLYR